MPTTTCAQPTLLTELVLPAALNPHGTYFGGAALALMAKAAFVAASRHARAHVVVAGCEQVDFASPVHVGDFVEAAAVVERVGTRSVTVGVRVTAETLATGARRPVVAGRFHMVVPRAPSDAPEPLRPSRVS